MECNYTKDCENSQGIKSSSSNWHVNTSTGASALGPVPSHSKVALSPLSVTPLLIKCSQQRLWSVMKKIVECPIQWHWLKYFHNWNPLICAVIFWTLLPKVNCPGIVALFHYKHAELKAIRIFNPQKCVAVVGLIKDRSLMKSDSS